MGSISRVAEVSETKHGLTLLVKQPSLRYLDELFKLNCAPELIGLKLFPNAKEVTESFAMFNAVRGRWRRSGILANPHALFVVVGDGVSPRTAATFAFRSQGICVSVDPLLRRETKWEKINRLVLADKKIEHLSSPFTWVKKVEQTPAIIIHCHSHADLTSSLRQVSSWVSPRVDVQGIVSMPCCVPDEVPLGWKLADSYADWGVMSPQRTINIYEPACS